jgi:hypothetical protein
MENIQLDPMAMIQAQAERITALTNENVQLTAAVLQLQQQISNNTPQQPDEVVLDSDAKQHIRDVTDEVVGAEMDPTGTGQTP